MLLIPIKPGQNDMSEVTKYNNSNHLNGTTFEGLGIELKNKQTGQIKTTCPECSDNRKNKKDRCLAVNIDTGLYHCHHCGWTGTTNNGGAYTDPKDYIESQRSISRQTLDKYHVTFSGSDINFNFYQNGKLHNTKVRSKDKKFRFTQSGKEQIPFNLDVINNSTELHITEGEIDCLSLIECGYTNTVSLPTGAKSLKWFETHTDELNHVEKFIICTDGDRPGIEARDKLLHILGEDRSFYVSYPKGLKDINEILTRMGANEVKRTIENAIPGNQIKKYLLEDSVTLDEVIESGKELFSIVNGIDRIPIARTGNFSLIKGKAKGRKTFFLTKLISIAVRNVSSGGITANVDGTIYCFDTEQERRDTQKVLQRICYLNSLEVMPDNLKVVNLRKRSTQERIKIIEDVIYNTPNLELVVIDGIRDLIKNINDPAESTEIVGKLLKWTGEKDIHIMTVLHENKSDGNSRGHIGTELDNKAETVISVNKDEKAGHLSIVSPVLTRGKDFEPFAISVRSDNGIDIPIIMDDYTPIKTSSNKSVIPHAYSPEQHEKALDYIFKNNALMWGDLIASTKNAWSKQGIVFGDNKARQFIQYWLDEEMIFKNENTKEYNNIPF